ncbi:MAG: hypothetical protein V3U71_09120 [Cocleimonas sp.]
MIQYIDKIIGFYFDGGFKQMIVDAELNEEEIEEWGSLAVLFNHLFGDVSDLNKKQKEEAFCIVEELYTKLEIDLMFGKIDKSTLHEIFDGHEIDPSKYRNCLQLGVSLIETNGINLFKLIKSKGSDSIDN